LPLPDGFALHPGGRRAGPLVDELRTQIEKQSIGSMVLSNALESYSVGQVEAAITELDLAVKEHPTYADLRCRLGRLSGRNQSPRRGAGPVRGRARDQPELRRGPASRRHLPPAHGAVRGGRSYRWNGRWPRRRTFADVQYYLGLARLKHGDSNGARQAFGAALALNPNYQRARFYQGLAAFLSGG
jgi:tetratricopeptide (TPR) repeat protein